LAVRFLPSGDCALTIEFGNEIDRDLNARVMGLHLALKRCDLPGVVETVPTFRSLMVHYDPLTVSQAALRDRLEQLLESEQPAGGTGDLVRLPVCYEGEFAPDLADIAAATGLTPDEIVRLHSETVHYVYMIGFAPGHPYMGDLPAALALPRRQTPRAKVPAGTVAIAVGLTVIYPFASPGGWHAIGRTPVPLFVLDRSPPALLRAGDKVRFVPITAADHARIAALSADGRYRVEREAAA
jgi:inhibitor of KinA